MSGESTSLKIWVSEFEPAVGAPLVEGARYTTWVKCEAPAGFQFMLRVGWSDGPGTTGFSTGTALFGTDQCIPSNNWSYTTIPGPGTPNLLYRRLTVWVRRGDDPPWVTTPVTPPDRPADGTFDVPTGWSRR